jgi:hypothetical protein
MDPKDHSVLVFEFLRDGLVPRVIPDAIDSAKSHEVNHGDFAL